LRLDRDAGGWTGVDGEGSAYVTGQARGAGGQLLAGAGRINPQISENWRTGARDADVQSGGTWERSSAAAQAQGHRQTGRQTNRCVVPKGILGLQHRLNSNGRTCRGITRLRREDQTVDAVRTHPDGSRGR